MDTPNKHKYQHYRLRIYTDTCNTGVRCFQVGRDLLRAVCHLVHVVVGNLQSASPPTRATPVHHCQDVDATPDESVIRTGTPVCRYKCIRVDQTVRGVERHDCADILYSMNMYGLCITMIIYELSIRYLYYVSAAAVDELHNKLIGRSK